MKGLEENLDFGKGDSIPWDDNYFKYRVLSQVLEPPYGFSEIWEAVNYHMPKTDYDVVKGKVFSIWPQVFWSRSSTMSDKPSFYPRP